MLLLLLLQLLSWWAVSATVVPVARMQRHRLLLQSCYDDHGNQLSNSLPSPELSSGDGGEFGELLLLLRPRAARLLEKSVLL